MPEQGPEMGDGPTYGAMTRMENQHTTAPCVEIPDMMTGDEVLAALLIETKYPACVLHRLRQAGKLHGIRAGRNYIYRRDDVARLLWGDHG